MAKPINIFRATDGLNTKVDPVRLDFDPETGITDLAAAYNVDIDQTGRVSRRKGYAATAQTGSCHSLFCDGGECLFVTGTSLCLLGSDYSSTAVATVTSGARMAYLQLHGRIYWANGHEKGYVEAGTNNTWIKGSYVGPDTTRQYSDPPVGTILAFFDGRVVVGQGSVLWYSDTFNLHAFDLARDFVPLENHIRMAAPLAGGIWVGTDKDIAFLEGTSFQDLTYRKRADYPAVEGTAREISLDKIGMQGLSLGLGVIFASSRGICLGTAEGQLYNLTEQRLNYPSARFGAGLVIDDRYIATLEP